MGLARGLQEAAADDDAVQVQPLAASCCARVTRGSVGHPASPSPLVPCPGPEQRACFWQGVTYPWIGLACCEMLTRAHRTILVILFCTTPAPTD